VKIDSEVPAATPRDGARGALVQLHGAGVRFGSVDALAGVDLTVSRGECIALVGSNGSGKTTLLRLLHGLVAHSGGRVVHADGVRQAMVFQRPFMLRLSVINNLVLALALARGPSRELAVRAAQALQRVGMAALAGRPARALSGGEQQRLALARAWAVAPQILFLDEPTANLDPSAKNAVEALIAGFHADGTTIVMSTHNLGQAKRLATRVVYLDHGAVRADAQTARFFAEHVEDRRVGLFMKGALHWDAV
jgi:tungstate transport system ATP-binding protein